MNVKVVPLVSLGLLVLLSACGGGGSSSTIASGVIDDPGGPASFGLLKPAESDAELVRNLRTGLQNASYVSEPQEAFSLPVPAAPGEGEPGSDSNGSPENSFSGTNLQESGVDEADIVKYDGEILYVVDFGEQDFTALPEEEPVAAVPDIAPQAPVIRLFRTDPSTPSAHSVAEITLLSPDFGIEGLYLAEGSPEKKLIAVGQSSPFTYWESFASDYYWREGKTLVQTWDVGDPEHPSRGWSLELDGSLLASRRIENTLYVVTRYSPAIEGLRAYPQSAEEVATNQALIDETPVASLLPDMRRENGVSTELLAPTDCYVPNADYKELIAPPAGGSLVTVTAIDLDSPDTIRSLCLNTYASGFYVSSTALYITANNSGDATLIHKVALSEQGPVYRGSGEVRGYLGTSNPAYLMSEREGDLRVVSSTWGAQTFPLPTIAPAVDMPVAAEESQEEPQEEPQEESQEEPQDDSFGRHRLTILRESADGTRLEEIALLPNSRRPQPIGKPDEDIYATRFLGDRAYIVTFQLIDPLYVLDLADPVDPKITGELEIPGFSKLLQAVGDNLLLGVGMEVPESGPNLTQGVKLALFDVADVTMPVSLAEVVVGKRGSYSPALDNYHALTLIEVDGHYRAAVPIQRNEELQDQGGEVTDPGYYYGWSDNGLYLFDIDPVAGSLILSDSLIIEKSSAQQPYSLSGLYNSRSVLHDDAVFFIDRGAVWDSLWKNGQ